MSLNKHMAMTAAYAVIVSSLLARERSSQELAALTGLHLHTVWKIINAMRRPDSRCLYIKRWGIGSDGGARIPMYALGAWPDVVKQQPLGSVRPKRRKVCSVFNLVKGDDDALRDQAG